MTLNLTHFVRGKHFVLYLATARDKNKISLGIVPDFDDDSRT
jgi:hypothetical protein